MIKNYQELVQVLRKLAPPKPGRVRVFRGQTKKPPDMLPAALRKTAKPRGSLAWDSYTRILAEDLMLEEQGQRRPDELLLFLLWVHAIAQHYGPGTSYLDVSHSSEVALWFALHEVDWADVTHVMGPPGPYDPKRDSEAVERWLRFQPCDTGYLFVFDVAKWDGSGFPGHGQLVDLAEAPPIFASSERLRIQKACLIAADAGTDAGDLKQFYACKPIPVGRPMTRCALLGSASDELFPGPDKDPWYRRFLCLPFISLVDYSAKRVAMERPWPVTVYMPTTQTATRDLAKTSVRLSPLTTNLGSLADLRLAPAYLAMVPWANHAITAATPILVETPLMFSSPPGDSDQWNHGILAGDMSNEVEAIDLRTGEPSGLVDLRNVFLEFSLLERAGWERIENAREELDLVRALWLMRNQNQFVVHVVLLSFPEQEERLVGPIIYGLHAAQNRFQWLHPQRQTWLDVDGLEPATKPFFVTLAILRALSPRAKPDPFPTLIAGIDAEQQIIVPVRRQAAQLIRVQGERDTNVWYALKEAYSDAPFFFSAKSSIGTLELKEAVPWSRLDPQRIRSSVPQG